MHAAKFERSPRLKRVHALLADGHERSTAEISDAANVYAVSACISELRANGADIRCRQIVRKTTGERIWIYRMWKRVPGAVA